MHETDGSLGSLWQHYPQSELSDQLVIHDVIDQSHSQQELTATVVEILVGREVVANVVARLPTTKQRETERGRGERD